MGDTRTADTVSEAETEIVEEPLTRDLGQLASLANRYHARAESAVHSAVRYAYRAGEALIVAKTLCSHGEWIPWLQANFHASDRTARAYMQLASNWQSSADLDSSESINGALKAIGKPKPEPEPEPEPQTESEPQQPKPQPGPESESQPQPQQAIDTLDDTLDEAESGSDLYELTAERFLADLLATINRYAETLESLAAEAEAKLLGSPTTWWNEDGQQRKACGEACKRAGRGIDRLRCSLLREGHR